MAKLLHGKPVSEINLNYLIAGQYLAVKNVVARACKKVELKRGKMGAGFWQKILESGSTGQPPGCTI